MSEKGRRIRLLEAKAAELEAIVRGDAPIPDPQWPIADIALIASILADHMKECP